MTLGLHPFWGTARLRLRLRAHQAFPGGRLEYAGTGGELFRGFPKAMLTILPALLLASLAEPLLAPHPAAAWDSFAAKPAVLAHFVGMAGHAAPHRRPDALAQAPLRPGRLAAALRLRRRRVDDGGGTCPPLRPPGSGGGARGHQRGVRGRAPPPPAAAARNRKPHRGFRHSPSHRLEHRHAHALWTPPPRRNEPADALPPGVVDAKEAAAEAGLRYVSDERPGITRRRSGSASPTGCRTGKPVRDEATLERIRSLAIPPAYRDVWICPHANGHIQATGRDDKGRKQYRYHPRWREVRDAAKYDHMMEFAAALPDIRARVDADMKKPGCRGRRCWRRSSTCWRPRSSASATTTT
jgi:hypothetical protein